MSDFPERIWAWGGCFPDFIESDRDCGEWQDDITESPTNPDDAVEYIRARIAEQREAELLEVLNLIVDRKWSIASPIHARPDNEDEATHLMCSIEKQAIDKARAILAKHKGEGGGDE